jgi:hypothetical protein
MVMSRPVVPSGADFEESRELGAHRPGRLSRLIGRVRPTPKGPVTTPAHVESGVGESLRVAEFSPVRELPSEEPQVQPITATIAPKESPMAPAAKPRRTRKRVVVDDIIPAQPAPDDDRPYRGNWDHSRGSQANARDEIDPTRDSRWYDD